ncbi:6-phosphogluconolactonase [Notoacmeibacter sp. MSK16QG-6]|uniref:6-phosphogluconolactonase n=1 Tax=Notoacmeibacter sp. MSK16QG-6 TaxID=2957982 RepID=UPI00209F70D1|nr:6-phosphogluconolactonase [Notoacmeibacter sp. MSK16QG-6]MCP1198554.1 6-phosphogluconolactonase [Notoacmeibacter sp. MSK16QG-6]
MNPSDPPAHRDPADLLADAPGEPAWREHSSGGRLAERLADKVAEQLSEAIEARGIATLILSGGRTPEKFFVALSEREIAWDKVIVTLVDERFVDMSSPRSNAAMVIQRLLQRNAADAAFEPLYEPVASAELAADNASRRLAGLPQPFDVVILGMGTDGHTASFFPKGDRLDEALDSKGEPRIISMNAPDAGEPRLTWTLPALASARSLHLHIEGVEKKNVLFDALSDEESPYPIRAVFNRAKSTITIWYAPAEG